MLGFGYLEFRTLTGTFTEHYEQPEHGSDMYASLWRPFQEPRGRASSKVKHPRSGMNLIFIPHQLEEEEEEYKT